MDMMTMSSSERDRAKQLVEAFVNLEAPEFVPFSFTYNGQSSKAVIAEWEREEIIGKPTDGMESKTVTYCEPKTGLEIRAEIMSYTDFPAVEWVLYFKNTGDVDTPIIENIQALDIILPGREKQETLVRYARGSSCGPEDFEPQKGRLAFGSPIHLAPNGGRSSDGVLPFLNLCQDGDRQGVILAIGWSGQWAADFSQGDSGEISVRAGLELTHLKLHPNEQIRTPRILTLFWEEDRLRAHNCFRRLIFIVGSEYFC